jgi:hypothetical protein
MNKLFGMCTKKVFVVFVSSDLTVYPTHSDQEQGEALSRIDSELDKEKVCTLWERYLEGTVTCPITPNVKSFPIHRLGVAAGAQGPAVGLERGPRFDPRIRVRRSLVCNLWESSSLSREETASSHS